MTIPYLAKQLFQTERPQLRKVQKAVMREVRKHKHLVVISPTGSGKTEAAYFASKVWGGKTLFVQPMKGLADATRERLNVYEDRIHSGKQWALQHSGSPEDPHLQSELAVTTIDQVLSGYLGFGGGSFMRGKAVLDSNLIFDEIQLYDRTGSLLTLFRMLEDVAASGGHFLVMTATFPPSLRKAFQDTFDCGVLLMDADEVAHEICLKMETDLQWQDIQACTEKQILICNTQKEQVAFYEDFPDKERLVVLNAKLLPKDRAKVEEDVYRYFGKEAEPNDRILLTTQLIEAGMDVSADVVWSLPAPIDNLVQRAGRCARWGGNGQFHVCTEGYRLYEEELVDATLTALHTYDGALFDWSLQQQLIAEVLDAPYANCLSDKNRLTFKRSLGDLDRNALIRNIQQISVIVSDTQTAEDFTRDAVSVHFGNEKKLRVRHPYKLESGEVKKAESIQIGDTILIAPESVCYDVCGFRFTEDASTCATFPQKDDKTVKTVWEDYEEEPWHVHTELVGEIFGSLAKKAQRNGRLSGTEKDLKEWSHFAALHDLGKLTEPWQAFIGAGAVPLAHNCYRPRNNRMIQNLRHNLISAEVLKPYFSAQWAKLEYNLLAQHHGRLPTNARELLGSYTFISDITQLVPHPLALKQPSLALKSKDILTPKDAELYGTFLYLEGCLMEADRLAIAVAKRRSLTLPRS